jgi:DNA-binding GntR family transcriptional regulator
MPVNDSLRNLFDELRLAVSQQDFEHAITLLKSIHQHLHNKDNSEYWQSNITLLQEISHYLLNTTPSLELERSRTLEQLSEIKSGIKMQRAYGAVTYSAK